MNTIREPIDLLVVGAGPIGISCGVAAQRAGLSTLLIDKGTVADALCHYPPNLVWFSTPELLEIADVPLVCSGAKPTGPELIRYYRRVAEHHALPMRLYEKVNAIERAPPSAGDDPDAARFVVVTTKSRYRVRSVVLATGFFDFPNRLHVEGEELPKVTHYYRGPLPYYGQRVLVIGGGNSAVEAALELYRNGAADVTLVHRGTELKRGIKYWVRPDIDNRIREGSIRAHFETRVVRIEEERVHLESSGRAFAIENDFVLALTGYHADFGLLERAGVELVGAESRPRLDPETMETNVPGLYCAGVVIGGRDTGSIFIENSREHGERIASHVKAHLGD